VKGERFAGFGMSMVIERARGAESDRFRRSPFLCY
jgi:hypothetical protein